VGLSLLPVGNSERHDRRQPERHHQQPPLERIRHALARLHAGDKNR
jgi:hypothetical protein